MAFNFITPEGRWNTLAMKSLLENEYGIPCVPIVMNNFRFCEPIGDDPLEPLTVDTLLALVDGKSQLDGLPREGFVLRSQDGTKSFKAVSNSYLLKYHG